MSIQNAPYSYLFIPANTGVVPSYSACSGSSAPYDFTIPQGQGNVYAELRGPVSGYYEIFITDGSKPCFGGFDINWTDPTLASLGVVQFTGTSTGAVTNYVALPFISGASYHFSMQAKITDINATGCANALTAAIYCHR